MSGIFLKLLNLSISASWLVLVVLAVSFVIMAAVLAGVKKFAK